MDRVFSWLRAAALSGGVDLADEPAVIVLVDEPPLMTEQSVSELSTVGDRGTSTWMVSVSSPAVVTLATGPTLDPDPSTAVGWVGCLDGVDDDARRPVVFVPLPATTSPIEVSTLPLLTLSGEVSLDALLTGVPAVGDVPVRQADGTWAPVPAGGGVPGPLVIDLTAEAPGVLPVDLSGLTHASVVVLLPGGGASTVEMEWPDPEGWVHPSLGLVLAAGSGGSWDLVVSGQSLAGEVGAVQVLPMPSAPDGWWLAASGGGSVTPGPWVRLVPETPESLPGWVSAESLDPSIQTGLRARRTGSTVEIEGSAIWLDGSGQPATPPNPSTLVTLPPELRPITPAPLIAQEVSVFDGSFVLGGASVMPDGVMSVAGMVGQLLLAPRTSWDAA